MSDLINMFKINLRVLRDSRWQKYIKRLWADKSQLKVTSFKKEYKKQSKIDSNRSMSVWIERIQGQIVQLKSREKSLSHWLPLDVIPEEKEDF